MYIDELDTDNVSHCPDDDDEDRGRDSDETVDIGEYPTDVDY